MAQTVIFSAEISECERYRYALGRVWEPNLPKVMFIGLNPSTADASKDDNTIRRCIDYAQRWGFGGLCMANLFAWRSVDRSQLRLVDDPVGPENDQWLKKLVLETTLIVAAWGNDGGFRGRAKEVLATLPKAHYLKLNATGEPAHPLYLAKNLQPRPYATT